MSDFVVVIVAIAKKRVNPMVPEQASGDTHNGYQSLKF
jgi:hypothetical protein